MDTKTTTHIKSKHEKLKTRIAILLIAQESGGVEKCCSKREYLCHIYIVGFSTIKIAINYALWRKSNNFPWKNGFLYRK